MIRAILGCENSEVLSRTYLSVGNQEDCRSIWPGNCGIRARANGISQKKIGQAKR